MLTFKGIIKYLLYIFIVGWMFFLGIIVGRGTSPVTFDVQKFQDRLKKIAQESAEQKEKEKESSSTVNIDFDALNNPDQVSKRRKPARTKPEPENLPVLSEEIPVKTGKKYATLSRKALNQKKKSPGNRIVVPVPKKKVVKKAAPKPVKKKVAPPPEKIVKKQEEKGIYTIQLAAFNNLLDAVSYMAKLDEKGIVSYKQSTDKDGTTWYRVRTGSFATRSNAEKYNKKLSRHRIKGIILKKDSHENIKR